MANIPLSGFETLYKSDSPKDFASGEYFQVRFESEVASATGREVFFVRERHGYFDDQHKRVVHPITTLSPEEGFATRGEAEERYARQLRHSFSPDPYDGMKYRRLD
jgi:hypothetical protein